MRAAETLHEEQRRASNFNLEVSYQVPGIIHVMNFEIYGALVVPYSYHDKTQDLWYYRLVKTHSSSNEECAFVKSRLLLAVSTVLSTQIPRESFSFLQALCGGQFYGSQYESRVRVHIMINKIMEQHEAIKTS